MKQIIIPLAIILFSFCFLHSASCIETNAPFAWLKSGNYADKVFKKVSRAKEVFVLYISLKGKIVSWEAGRDWFNYRQLTDDVFCGGSSYFLSKKGYEFFNKSKKYLPGKIGHKKYIYAYIPDDALAEKMLKDLRDADCPGNWKYIEKLEHPVILIGNRKKNSFGKMVYEWK